VSSPTGRGELAGRWIISRPRPQTPPRQDGKLNARQGNATPRRAPPERRPINRPTPATSRSRHRRTPWAARRSGQARPWPTPARPTSGHVRSELARLQHEQGHRARAPGRRARPLGDGKRPRPAQYTPRMARMPNKASEMRPPNSPTPKNPHAECIGGPSRAALGGETTADRHVEEDLSEWAMSRARSASLSSHGSQNPNEPRRAGSGKREERHPPAGWNPAQSFHEAHGSIVFGADLTAGAL